MEEIRWVEYVTAFGAISTPILVAALTIVGIRIRSKIDYKTKIEEQLREDRVEIYNTIIEPIVILMMSESAWKRDSKNKNKSKEEVALGIMLSVDYRRSAFKMALLGNDQVVRSYNNLMQHIYNNNKTTGHSIEDTVKIMNLLGTFLLSIRKGMGNETTHLDNFDMLEWFMTDARKYRR